MLSIDDVLELNNNEIGLIGPGNGCLTQFLERIFNQSGILHSQSIMHDAFGRFYTHHSLDRGYTYVIPKNKTPRWVKTSPLCGQVSGLIYCLWKRIIIWIIYMKESRKSIFNWNHISDELTEEQVEELKSYYHSYHKKFWAYKQALKSFKKWRLLGNSLSIVFTSLPV